MHQYKWISRLLSYGSIGLEAGSICAIFYPWTRPLILLSAAGLHLGIWLTMWPNYFPQTWCYIAAMTWPGETLLYIQNNKLLSNNITNNEFISIIPYVTSTSCAAWAATAICIFLCSITVFRIEYWPLTGKTKYSNRNKQNVSNSDSALEVYKLKHMKYSHKYSF